MGAGEDTALDAEVLPVLLRFDLLRADPTLALLLGRCLRATVPAPVCYPVLLEAITLRRPVDGGESASSCCCCDSSASYQHRPPIFSALDDLLARHGDAQQGGVGSSSRLLTHACLALSRCRLALAARRGGSSSSSGSSRQRPPALAGAALRYAETTVRAVEAGDCSNGQEEKGERGGVGEAVRPWGVEVAEEDREAWEAGVRDAIEQVGGAAGGTWHGADLRAGGTDGPPPSLPPSLAALGCRWAVIWVDVGQGTALASSPPAACRRRAGPQAPFPPSARAESCFTTPWHGPGPGGGRRQLTSSSSGVRKEDEAAAVAAVVVVVVPVSALPAQERHADPPAGQQQQHLPTHHRTASSAEEESRVMLRLPLA